MMIQRMFEDLDLESGTRYVRLVLSVPWPYTDNITVAYAVDLFYTFCTPTTAD